MALADELAADVSGVLSQTWDIRDGLVVPKTEDVALGGGGVKLAATFLYADLADSTDLAMWDRRVTARVCKAFLAASTRLIRTRGGHVRSFDGDRVMGVFLGEYKNTSAVKCALQVNWMFLNEMKPRFQAKFEALQNETHKLGHCVGVDTSEVLAVRSGIRNNNDLIWIGRAPNVAAKLSGLRDAPFNTFITGEVYDKLANESKIGGNGMNMWEERVWTGGPVKRVLRSSWTWKPA
jgi:class 3 adenylate cyclase